MLRDLRKEITQVLKRYDGKESLIMKIINEDVNTNLLFTEEEIDILKNIISYDEYGLTLNDIYTNEMNEGFETYYQSAQDFIGSDPENIYLFSNQNSDEIAELFNKLRDYVTSEGTKVSLERDPGASEFLMGYKTPIGNFIYEIEEGGFESIWYDPAKINF